MIMAGPGKFNPKAVLSKAVVFPNDEALARFQRLIGVEEKATAAAHDLHLAFNPAEPYRWADKQYGRDVALLEFLDDLVPLLIFEGDVGTGKTALAETIGDRVAREFEYDLQMVKMSTQVRGTGYVGEMGTILAETFRHVVTLWERKAIPTILVMDEADSLLTTREAEHHHHEDKSGVNTILQHLDDLRQSAAQVAVVAITNRIRALDPAVRRRAADVFTFERPTREQRTELFSRLFDGLGFKRAQLEQLADRSEPRTNRKAEEVPFSYSDLTLRLALPALRAAMRRSSKLRFEDLALRLDALHPTPRMTNQ